MVLQIGNWKLSIGNDFWAGVAQLVEHQPSKLRVASSNLVARSRVFRGRIGISGPRSSGVERLLGKEEVMSSNLIAGSSVPVEHLITNQRVGRKPGFRTNSDPYL